MVTAPNGGSSSYMTLTVESASDQGQSDNKVQGQQACMEGHCSIKTRTRMYKVRSTL